MSDPTTTDDFPADFESLVAAAIDGSLSPTGRARLGDLVASDPAAREFYLDYLATHAVLQWSHDALPAMNLPTTTTPDLSQAKVRMRSITSIPRFHLLSLAAALLLTAAAVAIYVFAVSRPLSPVPSDSALIATLIDATGDVFADDDIANPGSEIPARTVSIASGSAELLLTNQVSVKLVGDTALTMHSNMAASLSRGSAEFNCPPGTEGYTVHLPDGARVVDLGTRFTVAVDPNDTPRIAVTEGSVNVYRGGDANDAAPLKLTTGFALTDPNGRRELAWDLPIVNGDFDADEPATPADRMTGWRPVAGQAWVSDGRGASANEPAAAKHGSGFLLMRHPRADVTADPSATLAQRIALDPIAAAVDAHRRTLHLTLAYARPDPRYETAAVHAVFYDRDGHEIDRHRHDLEATPTRRWGSCSLDIPIPAGARAVGIELIAVRLSGTITNVAFDRVAAHVDGLPEHLLAPSPAPGSAPAPGVAITKETPVE